MQQLWEKFDLNVLFFFCTAMTRRGIDILAKVLTMCRSPIAPCVQIPPNILNILLLQPLHCFKVVVKTCLSIALDRYFAC